MYKCQACDHIAEAEDFCGRVIDAGGRDHEVWNAWTCPECGEDDTAEFIHEVEA